MVEAVELGRHAMDRHAWTEAMEVFGAADRDGGLSPADLELLGAAAWWAGRPDESTEALERAFAGHAEARNSGKAAWVAMVLAYQAFRRRAGSVGGGWLARAEHLLETEPESALHARVVAFHALGALMATNISEGSDLADRAIELARRHDDRNTMYMATSFKGMAEILVGNWRDGIALIDEAAAAAASGQLDLRVSSDIFCNTIAACRNIGDYKRATQWANEGERWMRREVVGGYPGICRVHRAELNVLRGNWPEAEQEARQACEELERFGLRDSIGWAHYQIGEVRLRMGDLEAAAEAFERAYEHGHDAQPGLALLQLARGESAEAGRSIARALAAAAGTDGSADRPARARLLPAQVEIALAAGDLEGARTAVTELESIAADFQRPVYEAVALTGRGELLLAEHRPSEASPLLGRSWRLWLETELPYESARARLHYAESLAAEGDQTAASRDLRAARAVFERLGATLDIQAVDALLGQEVAATPGPPRRVTRTFMFTDIVTSTDLIGLIGDDAWGELLGWHDRELRAAFARHRGEEVRHTGDGFFITFERAVDALECGVDIQRRLARHRHEHGFAPSVRIGVHTSEAARDGRDYRGRGVHVAARIGAAAASAEILASDGTLREIGSTRFGLSDLRNLTLKGVDEPVDVRSVDWR
ncbi:MAG TPA: adenylate/guanylate cyclase domain-containing protein [Candidatus Limnocylindrales bacterium]|nr:adenylate/guanylate cyclase domain-containing protein [Candidatus Limnocylindrales bacterium]